MAKAFTNCERSITKKIMRQRIPLDLILAHEVINGKGEHLDKLINFIRTFSMKQILGDIRFDYALHGLDVYEEMDFGEFADEVGMLHADGDKMENTLLKFLSDIPNTYRLGCLMTGTKEEISPERVKSNHYNIAWNSIFTMTITEYFRALDECVDDYIFSNAYKGAIEPFIKGRKERMVGGLLMIANTILNTEKISEERKKEAELFVYYTMIAPFLFLKEGEDLWDYLES